MEKTKLPAQKLSRAEMLKQIREHNARVPEMVRKGFGAHAVGVLDHFYAMNEDEVFVWRIRLDCGCTSLASTVGNDAALLERVAQWCPRHYMNYRTVTEWADRRLVSETGLLWDDMPEMHKIHRGKERARWTVTLECGHSQDVETKKKAAPVQPDRTALERRLKNIEAEAEALREALK